MAGTSYSDLNISVLQSQVAYVTQEPAVFHGTVEENVTMWDSNSDSQRTANLLNNVGLPHLDNRSTADSPLVLKSGGMDLSGGERQRVAVVRALINEPQLLLADEPTGALDQATADQLGQLLVELNAEENVTLIPVTHSEKLAAQMARTVELNDGQIK